MSPLMISTSRFEAILRTTSNDITVVSLVVSISTAISVPGLSLACQSGNDAEDMR